MVGPFLFWSAALNCALLHSAPSETWAPLQSHRSSPAAVGSSRARRGSMARGGGNEGGSGQKVKPPE
eukprot:140328-Alexandrium_andersonii.AAC.1